MIVFFTLNRPTILVCAIFLELAEMDVQREEVQKLERELSKAEECLEQERAKSEGTRRQCTWTHFTH